MNNLHIDLKEHLINLINALVNISPSRNRISQFILLLPQSLTVIERSYPEFTSEAKTLMEILGVEFDNEIKVTENSFAEALRKQIHYTFDWLDDEFSYKPAIRNMYDSSQIKKIVDVRSSLAKLLGRDADLVPNPYAEWCRLVIKRIQNMGYKDKHIKLLRMLLEREPLTPEILKRLRDEAEQKLDMNPAETEEVFKLIIRNPGASEFLYSQDYGTITIHTYMAHCIYHLDLLLYSVFCRHRVEKETFSIRHKKTIEKVLAECECR